MTNPSLLHGWLVLDKPLGLTSTQALGKARRILQASKAGHAGTLDPLATGVLPLAFGEATKLIAHVMDGVKEYEFSVVWGEARNTDDAEGQVTARSDIRPSEAALLTALPQFVGAIRQTPPAFSALKLDGQRAYDLARAGQTVALKDREITIEELKLLDNSKERARLFVRCGKGTYVRALARDLAIKLGTYGYVGQLRRLRSGPFTLAQAIPLDKLEEMGHKGAARQAVLSLLSSLDDILVLSITATQAQQLRRGQTMLMTAQLAEQLKGAHLIPGLQAVAVDDSGIPVAIVGWRSGTWCVVRGFYFTGESDVVGSRA